MSNPQYPSYYDELKDNDIIFAAMELVSSPAFRARMSDGRIEPVDTQMVYDGPWSHVKPSYQYKCTLWHNIVFNLVSRKFNNGMPFVHSQCQMCFKVVVRPRTLEGLFALEKMQKEMDYHAKCGIEPRPTVHGFYGGYFYNVGLKEGLDKFKIVWEAVDKDSVLQPALLPGEFTKRKTGTMVLLKRA